MTLFRVGVDEMKDSVERLITALNEEYEIYKEVLEIARKKRKIIIEGRIKELDSITSKEQAMIFSIAKLENIRESIIKDIVKELDTDSIVNISELTQYLDEESKNDIIAIKSKFKDILKAVKDENDLNSMLIEQSLEYIEFNKNLLTTLENKGNTYGSNADEKDIKTNSNLFDVKI